jgi:hypothetical protein
MFFMDGLELKRDKIKGDKIITHFSILLLISRPHI